MRRRDIPEINDHPALPEYLRNLVTDALQSVWDFGNSYNSILGPLLDAMECAGTREVLDLCSGGGGPWRRLARESLVEKAPAIAVRLTDKYPNRGAFGRAEAESSLLCFESSPVDATGIPEHLQGFRTIFSSFHHFGPETAGKILRDAMDKRRGVGIFELATRSAKTMLTLCLIPPLTWILTPVKLPFRWSRLFWTYVIPMVPFVLFYDGIASCLRAYSHKELEEMIRPLRRADYKWEIGEERSGFLPVTYLLGYPVTVQPE
ncbi:MAG TPA: hypothetical protein VE178_18625 [Silvibacterium sp.]|nr:hypothetical protein [Silvibacterium sp.]